MVKRILKKLLLIIFILLILNNFFMIEARAAVLDDVVKVIENVLGGIVGILSWPFRGLAVLIGDAINSLTAIIAYTEKPTDTSIDTGVLTPFDILYNKVPILDINFFEIGIEDNIVNQMRTGVATWYYVMRILASGILLVILIYVGIRMAISTIAADKARYKKMLVDWVCSLALIFVIQYIIIFTLNINNTLVNAMSLTVDSKQISETFDEIQKMSSKIVSLDAIGATVIFCMLVWQTIGLLIAYFNRMLKIAFLIIISPLITLTYSIDKMGDGKAQALGKWLKEFAFTVLIQPFHCIIYMCLIDAAFKMLVDNMAKGGSANARDALATALVAILCVKFVKEAEKIVRKIFAFQDDNASTSLVAGMAASAVLLSNAKKFGRSTRNTVNAAGNIAKSGARMFGTAKVEALALGAMIANKDNSGKDFAARKEEVITKKNDEKAEKINKKLDKKDKIDKLSSDEIKEVQAARNEKLEERTKEIIARKSGAISEKEAKSQASLELAKERRTQRGPVRSRISKARGTLNSAKNYINSSETIRELANKAKSFATGGAALMVGAGVYGTQGNIATAISSGAALHSGIQEFMKSSSRTLINATKENLTALDARTPEEVQKEFDTILEKKEEYGDLSTQKAKEELDKVFKNLKDKLPEGVELPKTKIKNIIANQPDEAPKKIGDIFKDLEKSQGISISNADQAELFQFANRHAIVNRMEKSKDIMPETAFVNSVLNDYTSNREYVKQDAEQQRIIEELKIDNIKEESELHKQRDIKVSNKTVKAIEKEYDKEIKRLTKKMEKEKPDKDSDIEKEYNQQIKQLESDKINIVARALANAENELNEKSLEMAQEYQKKLDDMINELENNGADKTELIKYPERLNNLKDAKKLLDDKIATK